MIKHLVPLFALSSLATVGGARAAHADAASDRVFLTAGAASGCAGAVGFKRITQDPDGGQTLATTEFQVPDGAYLEITSVEYATPYYLGWASGYTQAIDLTIRKRVGSGSASVFSGRYQNQTTFASDNGALVDVGELVGPGAFTHVAAFPVGPLMSSNARLCVAVASSFWTFGGSVRVRGRLIPTDERTAPSSSTQITTR